MRGGAGVCRGQGRQLHAQALRDDVGDTDSAISGAARAPMSSPAYPEATTYWTVILVLGAVVIVAVVVLLSLLIAFVKRSYAGTTSIGGTLTDITKNTADTALITTTGGGLDLVLAEGLQHHLFLGRVVGSIPTPAGKA